MLSTIDWAWMSWLGRAIPVANPLRRDAPPSPNLAELNFTPAKLDMLRTLAGARAVPAAESQ